MFCVKCGKELKDDAKFCPFCGTVVRGNQTDEIEDEFQLKSDKITSFEPLSDEKNNISKIEIILLSISGVIIILSLINLGLIFSIISLTFNIFLSVLSIIIYLKQKCKYEILVFALNISFMLYNIGMVVYLLALK